MPGVRVVGRRGFVRGTKRKTFWLGTVQVSAETALAAATASLHGSLNAAALALRPFTIVRTISDFWVASDQIVATEQPFGAIGVALADDRAIAAGAGSLPRAYGENADSSFLFHQFWAAKSFVAGTPATYSPNAWSYFHADQRGQRKIAIGDDIGWVIHNAEGGDGCTFVWNTRMLCLAN